MVHLAQYNCTKEGMESSFKRVFYGNIYHKKRNHIKLRARQLMNGARTFNMSRLGYLKYELNSIQIIYEKLRRVRK